MASEVAENNIVLITVPWGAGSVAFAVTFQTSNVPQRRELLPKPRRSIP